MAVNMINLYMGANGEYQVPDAIMWLANEANKMAGVTPIDCTERGRRFWKEPGYKVIEDWGQWRDAEELKRQSEH